MKVCLEVKLRFQHKEDRESLIKMMREYSALVRYGIKSLRPSLDATKQVYKVLTEKFANVPARTVCLAVQGDVVASINSFAGLQAKDFPLSLRFDKDNAEFFIEDNMVKVKLAIKRVKKGVLEWVTATIMPQRSLAYKYYKLLFSTEKGYHLPFKLIMRDGQIYAKVTVEKALLTASNGKPHVSVGIDLNAFWVGKSDGHPLAVAFLRDNDTFARQPLLLEEWAVIPRLIRENQRLGKRKVKKIIQNQFGLILKRLLYFTRDFDVTFNVEDLKGLSTKIKGPYSKFFYHKFLTMLEAKSLEVNLVDPAYTSQKCSRCGKLGTVQNRTFFCSNCYPKGFHRDINAAINIAKA